MPEPIRWSAAEAAIGEDDPDADWVLKPQEHAALLPSEAGVLQRILSRPGDMPRLMARFVKRDVEADRQQRRYRSAHRWVKRLAYAAAGTGLFALSMHLILGYVSDLQPILVGVHALLIVSLAACAAWINGVDPRSQWLSARGEAELLRVALFDRVLASEEPSAPTELPLLPLQLAYFRRYQLDVQLRYFEGRGRQLTRSAGLPRWYTAPVIAVVIIAFALAALLFGQLAFEYGLDVPNALILKFDFQRIEPLARWSFVALALSSIYAIVLTQQNVSEDSRNGARYLALHRNLAFLKEEAYERVRQAAEAGERPLVEKFVRLVHDQMIAEQNEWISFNRLVNEQDELVAARSAVGLAELFADRFEAKPGAAQN